MKAFREGPFDISLHHLQASFFSICDEVIAWLVIFLLLML